MFHEAGAYTGRNLPAMIEVAREAQTVIGGTFTSQSIIAGSIDWEPATR